MNKRQRVVATYNFYRRGGRLMLFADCFDEPETTGDDQGGEEDHYDHLNVLDEDVKVQS